ncbi:Kanamycin nucleotidyltransferase [Staphylococcus aureus]|nr:Kanamycin nucleotidyltransferase [Staphylococcus aureus]
MTREERMKIVHEIKERILDKYGDDVKAIGVYGSLGRQTDGPYSDIEMMCVMSTEEAEFSHEWTTGKSENASHLCHLKRSDLHMSYAVCRMQKVKSAASRVSVMTVKTSDTCSSRRRSQLVCKRMPGADKPVRARQRVLAGVGAQP